MTVLCNPQLLNALVSTKEFRIIPTPIFRQVQMCADLPVESKFLWTVLWELCSPNSHFEKQLTWGFLSKRLGKSESSIRRWSKSLVKLGYLKISEIYSADGSQLPSKFRVGVPIQIAKQVWESAPDRFKRSDKTADVPENKPDAETPSSEVSKPEVKPAVRKSGFANFDKPSDGENESKPAMVDNKPAPVAAKPVQVNSVGGVEDADGVKAGNAQPVRKSGVESLSERMKRLEDNARKGSGKGSNSSQEKRSTEKLADAHEQGSSSYRSELEAILKSASKARNKGQVGVSISEITQAFKSGTQEKNLQVQDNKHSSAHLANKVKSELMIRLGYGYDFNTLTEQFVASIERGAFKKFSFKKAMNIGIKLVREERWLKPRVVTYA